MNTRIAFFTQRKIKLSSHPIGHKCDKRSAIAEPGRRLCQTAKTCHLDPSSGQHEQNGVKHAAASHQKRKAACRENDSEGADARASAACPLGSTSSHGAFKKFWFRMHGHSQFPTLPSACAQLETAPKGLWCSCVRQWKSLPDV